MIKALEQIGLTVIGWMNLVVDVLRLFFETLYWIIAGPLKRKPLNVASTFEQMVFMGVNSIVIVIFVTFFTGVVLAMQSAHQLSKMGGTIYVASLVTISI